MTIPELDELGARLGAALSRPRARRRRPRPAVLIALALGVVAVPAAATNSLWRPLFEHAPAGAVQADDPEGGPPWKLRGDLRPAGARAGQTCLQVLQPEARSSTGKVAGGEFTAPMCGDLQRHDVVADVRRFGPRPGPSTFGPGPQSPRRVLVFGAVSDRIRRVDLRVASSTRELPLAERGRAFLAVLPADTPREEVDLRLTFTNGRTQDLPAPRRLNAAPLNPRQARLLRPIVATYDPTAKTVTISTRLSSPPRRMTVTFLGRGLRLRPTANGNTYSAIYDIAHGKYRRRIRRGRTIPVSYVLCSPNCFAARFAEVTIK